MSKSEQVRQRLRRAAMQVLAETGSNQVNVSELAKTAGVARGTVYNNMDNPAIGFDELAVDLAKTLTRDLRQALAPISDPVAKVSAMIRLMLKRAEADPVWTAFIMRFVLVDKSLKLFWAGLPAEIIEEGRAQGAFKADGFPTASITSHMGGSVLMAMFYIHNGQRDCDSLGRETVRLVLQSIGVDAETAKHAAALPLPVREDA